MSSLAEVQEKLDSLQYQAHKIYSEAGADLDFSKVQCIPGTTEDKLAAWKALNIEVNQVGAERDRLRAIEAEMKANEIAYQQGQQPINEVPFIGNVARPDSLRKQLDASPEWKLLRERGKGSASLEIPEFKTLITLADISPQNDRRGLVHMGMETRTVIDMIGESNATSATVEWYEETTFTNAAAETAEGEPKPEGALDWTLRTSPVRTIAVWIPVTKQAIQDNSFLESEIRNRLILMVQRREETQVLAGDGIGENIAGILSLGTIQTEAKGANPTPTAIFNALQKVRGAAGSGFMEPDGIVMHPLDLQAMYTLQSTTGDYVLQAILQATPDFRLWGLPIRQTTAMTQNTALVGDFSNGAEVFRRGGLTVTASTEHSTYFTENKVAILAESRIALAVQVPTAFCSVTGI